MRYNTSQLVSAPAVRLPIPMPEPVDFKSGHYPCNQGIARVTGLRLQLRSSVTSPRNLACDSRSSRTRPPNPYSHLHQCESNRIDTFFYSIIFALQPRPTSGEWIGIQSVCVNSRRSSIPSMGDVIGGRSERQLANTTRNQWLPKWDLESTIIFIRRSRWGARLVLYLAQAAISNCGNRSDVNCLGLSVARGTSWTDV
jgi:hypothetical protein